MTHIDHIIEVKDGGDFWDADNLRVVCKFHHASKTIETMGKRASGVSPDAPPHRRFCWSRVEGRWEPQSPNALYCAVPGENCPHE